MERGVTTIFAPTNATCGFEVLVNEVAALLKVVNTFDAIAPTKLLPYDFGLLDLDPFLSHDVFPHLQHRHRVLVWVRRIEVVRRRLFELHITLLPSHWIWLIWSLLEFFLSSFLPPQQLTVFPLLNSLIDRERHCAFVFVCGDCVCVWSLVGPCVFLRFGLFGLILD